MITKIKRSDFYVKGNFVLDCSPPILTMTPAQDNTIDDSLVATNFNPNHDPKSGEFAGGEGGGAKLTEADHYNIQNWQWPDSNPMGGMDYYSMRKPSTKEGKAFTKTLQKLPTFTGVTYRGLVLNDKDTAKLGGDITMKLHSSSSKQAYIALSFMEQNHGNEPSKNQIVMKFKQKSGRDITGALDKELQGTQEVVLPAGTKYKFLRMTRHDDTTHPDNSFLEFEYEEK